MRWLIASSLKFRVLVLGIAAAVALLGIVQLRSAPVAAFPEFSQPFVEVQTEALGLSAEEVESLITVPLEADLLNGVAWLEEIRSQSVEGLSSILLLFEPGTDVLEARQLVQERLTQAAVGLPNVSKAPTMLQPLSSTTRVMMIGLTSDELSLIEMSVLSRWTVAPRLRGVPGVANVAIWGQRNRQLQVQVEPEKLRDLGVTVDQVIETTGDALWVSPLSFLNASYPGVGGFIDTPTQRLGIRHLSPITSPADLAQVRVVDTDALRLGDVASVVEGHPPLIGDAIVNDGPGLILVVEKFPGESVLEVTRGVEDALVELAPAMRGVQVNADLLRPGTYVETAIDNLTIALIIAAVFGGAGAGAAAGVADRLDRRRGAAALPPGRRTRGLPP